MSDKQRVKNLAARYRVDHGKGFRLADFDPGDTGDLASDQKSLAKEALAKGVQELAQLQDKLYAQNRWALLLIIQAMDAAGKDSAIKHVMSGINPQGCQVYSFKVPSDEELDHDYLWRCLKVLPERGRIGIFNRSYYEETLVVRVHPELLTKQQVPPELITGDIWKERFQDICHVERYLTRNGVVIRKVFLYVSKKEQRKRFLERIDNPAKNWKFSSVDATERAHWDEYMAAYAEMIENTATPYAPWFVVPADHKWFTRLVVASVVVDALRSLHLEYPEVSDEKVAELKEARTQLGEGAD
jgi:PPK2 family polyphosphate:nucleotide phosphotransferase